MLSACSRMLLPGDLEKLQAVFDEVLREYRLPADCEDAQFLASRLIQLYQDVCDPASLRAKMGSSPPPA